MIDKKREHLNDNGMNSSLSSSRSSLSKYRSVKKYNFDGLDIEILTTDTEDFSDHKPLRPLDVPMKLNENLNLMDMDVSIASSYNGIESDLNELNALLEKNRKFDDIDDDSSFYTNTMNDPLSTSTPMPSDIEMKEEMVQNQDEHEGAAGLWGKNENLPCFKVPAPYAQSKNLLNSIQSSVSQQPLFTPTGSLINQPFKGDVQLPKTNPFASVSRDTPPPPIISNSGTIPKQNGAQLLEETIQKAAEDPLVYSTEGANCGMCRRHLEKGNGIVLKDCLHVFCRRCLTRALEDNDMAVMTCPTMGVRCEGEVRDEEVKAILTPEAYEKFVHNSLIKLNLFDLAEVHENFEYVETKKGFKCYICLEEIAPGNGVTLKNCIHDYCKVCLTKYINKADSAVVKCPFKNDKNEQCVGIILDTELRAFASADAYLRILNKSLAENEADPNAYHCKTPNCAYWLIIEDQFVENFICDICKRENCVKCRTVHQGISCRDYQGRIRNNADYMRTENQVREELAIKKIQPCPKCNIAVQRIDGCNNMQCTRCQTRFIWR